MTQPIAFASLFATLLAFAAIGTPASALEPLVHEDVRFDVPQTDLIPGVAAVRAACSLTASGEPLAPHANETVRTILGISAGPCAIVVVLFGVDVGLPVFNTTTLGRSSFFIPGVATATLGIVDLTVDLVTSLIRRHASRIATSHPWSRRTSSGHRGASPRSRCARPTPSEV